MGSEEGAGEREAPDSASTADWRSSCRSASSLSIAWRHYPGVLRDNEDQPEHGRRVSAGRAPPTGLEPVTLRDAIVNCHRYSLLLDHARDLREQTRTRARHFASLAAIS